MSIYDDLQEDARVDQWMEREDQRRVGHDSCSTCHAWIFEDEGTYCDGCGKRICANCAVVSTVPRVVAGELVTDLRFECKGCAS